MDKPKTILGFVGVQLDAGRGAERWNRWRPTVSIFQQPDVEPERLVLLYERKYRAVADHVAADVVSLSPHTAVECVGLDMPDPWDFEPVYAALHDHAQQAKYTDEDGLWVHITTGTHVAQICLFLLTEAGFLPGKLLQTRPPRRGERVGGLTVIDLNLARYDRLATRFAAERTAATGWLKAGIETKNSRFNRLIDRVERVAGATSAPILLTGPTGAGKTQLARRIAVLKQRRQLVDGGLVEVNCATLRGDAAMSTLFGHTRGAFTGALAERKGLLREADGGVLFLDEIGELGLDEQAMLLRALEQKRFLPLGSDREASSDFHLIAGSNHDLRADVASGRFRDDLLARIDLWSFELPGLAERREDIAPNLDHELELARVEHNRHIRLNREARDTFLQFATSPSASWRGNFRDLNAAVTRMATLSDGGRIDVDVVHEEIERLRAAWDRSSRDVVDDVLGDRSDDLDRFDRCQLAEVIRVCHQSASLSEAGRTLFAASRARRRSINDADRLRKYLAKWDLRFDALRRTP